VDHSAGVHCMQNGRVRMGPQILTRDPQLLRGGMVMLLDTDALVTLRAARRGDGERLRTLVAILRCSIGYFDIVLRHEGNSTLPRRQLHDRRDKSRRKVISQAK
jgi:hypothetical protein